MLSALWILFSTTRNASFFVSVTLSGMDKGAIDTFPFVQVSDRPRSLPAAGMLVLCRAPTRRTVVWVNAVDDQYPVRGASKHKIERTITCGETGEATLTFASGPGSNDRIIACQWQQKYARRSKSEERRCENALE